MNDFERFIHATPKEGSEAQSEVRDLLRAAGPRAELPAGQFAELKEAARTEWSAMVAAEQARQSRWGLGLALAASLVLALGAAWWWQSSEPLVGGTMVASVLRVEGDVRGAGTEGLVAGSVLTGNAEIETGSGRLALRLSGGESIRLDAATRVRLTSGNRVELERGAVYFDSTGALGEDGIEIATEFGTVRDIGTQFEVRVDETAGTPLRVRVREGEIALEHGGDTHSALGGEELRLQADGGVVVAEASVYGPDWAWVLAAAPTFEIDSQPLSRYLEWVTRETGWSVSFDDPELAASAETVRLGGTIEELTADESLSVVLPGSGMDYRLEDGVLFIGAAAGN